MRSLINRAVRLNNHADIEEATIDKKGVVYCHDPLIESELQREYSALDAEMHRVGLDLLYTLGQVDLGEVGYDPMHEDPFGTSDLDPDPILPDGNHIPDGWDDPGWHE